MLVLLTSTMLGIYSILALKDFEKDKIAYVFDTNLSYSRSTAVQIRSELDFTLDQVKFLMRGFDYVNGKFHNFTKKTYLPNDPLIESLVIFKWSKEMGRYVLSDWLKQSSVTEEIEENLNLKLQSMLKDTLEAKLALQSFDIRQGKWLFGLRYEDNSADQPLVVIAMVKRATFLEAFTGAQLQDSYLVNHNGEIILKPIEPAYKKEDKNLKTSINETLAKLNAPAGVNEFKLGEDESWLVSAAKVNAGDLKVISIVPKSAALEAAKKLQIKSALFLGFLICITVLLSVFSSNRLTSALKNLFEATRRIGQGDFDVQVKVKAQDEIGVVGQGFNQMTKEIKRLLAETAEKARMESELQTASLVQSTLFPEGNYDGDQVEIKGFYQPASECGGDWWYYTQVGQKTYFWIRGCNRAWSSCCSCYKCSKKCYGSLGAFSKHTTSTNNVDDESFYLWSSKRTSFNDFLCWLLRPFNWAI